MKKLSLGIIIVSRENLKIGKNFFKIFIFSGKIFIGRKPLKFTIFGALNFRIKKIISGNHYFLARMF
jgi:hypothetical protein